MKLLLAFAILSAAPYAGSGGEQTVRESRGRIIGTATTSGSQMTFRDAGGHTAGTGTDGESGQTTYRDSRGNIVGTSSQ